MNTLLFLAILSLGTTIALLVHIKIERRRQTRITSEKEAVFGFSGSNRPDLPHGSILNKPPFAASVLDIQKEVRDFLSALERVQHSSQLFINTEQIRRGLGMLALLSGATISKDGPGLDTARELRMKGVISDTTFAMFRSLEQELREFANVAEIGPTENRKLEQSSELAALLAKALFSESDRMRLELDSKAPVVGEE